VNVAAVTSGNRTVLLDYRTGVYIGLNEVAGKTWDLIASGVSPRDAARILASEYDASVARVELDMADLIREFASLGLVTVSRTAG
jgi:hypothetical protein